VLPTRSEAFGMVLQEAAAAGLPVVSTNINAISEIVINGRTGILLKPRDVDGLGLALRQLLADSELRLQMGTRAREHMKQVCDPLAYRSKLLALVQGALARLDP
jgi:starch synthase